MLTQSELREKITNQIVTALRAGNVPFWRQPWSHHKNAGYPANAISGKPYRGINTLLTSLGALEKGYASKWWGTYPQWQALGGQVRRGEKGTGIILFKPVRKVKINDQGEEEVSSFPIMRSWTIFNVAQVDGDLDQYRASASSTEPSFVDYEPAEKVMAATGANIRYLGDRAFFSPDGDFIQMPRKEAFQKAHEFYGVQAHELVHWTGHKTRLNRPSKLGRFGDESYAVEELVAELGRAFLLAELGIPQSDDLTNVTAYLAHWLKVLEQDHTAIFTASSASAGAVDYILSFSQLNEAEDAEAEAVVQAA
jgi:antirestriction protein ArdC